MACKYTNAKINALKRHAKATGAIKIEASNCINQQASGNTEKLGKIGYVNKL